MFINGIRFAHWVPRFFYFLLLPCLTTTMVFFILYMVHCSFLGSKLPTWVGFKDSVYGRCLLYTYVHMIIKVWKVPTAQNWISSSAEAVFDLKIPSLDFQAKQQIQKRKVPRMFLDHSIENSSKRPTSKLRTKPKPENFQAVRTRSDKKLCRRESVCLIGYSLTMTVKNPSRG